MSSNKTTLGLFVAHRGKLVDYASGIVGSRAHGEDVVQEAWLRFSSATHQRLLEEPLGYLYRIVRNVALDGRRRMAREGQHLAGDAEPAADALPAATLSPEILSLQREELAIVRAALNELPERTRIALYMHRLEGRKLREIAEHLGVSIGLAHALVAEGVGHCRRRLRGS